MYTYQTNIQIREDVRAYLKQLRDLAKQENHKEVNQLKKVIFTEPRKGYLNGEYVDRLVLFLRGTGCSLARETGGCTFCGFYNATNFGAKVPDDDYLAQIHTVVTDPDINFARYPIICLYNDGSMLREEEISFTALIKIIEILNQQTHVKKIVIESRVEDITEAKLARMCAATKKELEIAVGFESANPEIRDLCINKNFENRVFEANVQIARKYNVSIVPLIILKPPFLTEKEAIADYVKSLQYIEQFGLKRIDMELPTVETHTLVHELWKNDMYRPAWLWSVIRVLQHREELALKTPIYISPMVYSVDAEVKASNCPECDHSIYQAFEEYNRSGDISIFDTIDCTCKSAWALELEKEHQQKELPARVTNTLQILRNA